LPKKVQGKGQQDGLAREKKKLEKRKKGSHDSKTKQGKNEGLKKNEKHKNH